LKKNSLQLYLTRKQLTERQIIKLEQCGLNIRVLPNTILADTFNNASDYRANGLLSDYTGWTNGLSG